MKDFYPVTLTLTVREKIFAFRLVPKKKRR